MKSNLGKALALTALELVDDGFIPPRKPACAYFVSEVIKRTGWPGEIVNPGWVPSLIEQSEPVTTPEPGDLVIFKQTYDAVSPAGIGPEDDSTHIGIVVGKGPGGTVTFAHYSAGRDKAVVDLLDDYWKEHLQEYRRWPWPQEDLQEEPAGQPESALLKLFYHPEAQRPVAIIEGQEEEVLEMGFYLRTRSGWDVTLQSHYYEKCPALAIGDKIHPVMSIGPNGVKYSV